MMVSSTEYGIVVQSLKAALLAIQTDTTMRRYQLQKDWNEEGFLKQLKTAEVVVGILEERSTHGNCQVPFRWSWNSCDEGKLVEKASSLSHKRLRLLVSAAEACKLFVKYLESTCDGGETQAEIRLVDELT